MRWWGRGPRRPLPTSLVILVSLSLLAAGCGGAAQPPPGAASRPPTSQQNASAPSTDSPRAAEAGAGAAPAADPDTQNTSLRRTTVAYSSYANAFAPLYVAA